MSGERVALVTGAASGIGRACAHRLGADGLRLALVDVDAGALEACAAELGAVLAVADVSSRDQVAAAVDAAHERLGRIDVVVNAAGITGSQLATDCTTTPIEEWERVLAVNLTGTFLVCRAALAHMLEAGRGIIVNIASVAGIVAFPGRCAYTASKGGVLQLTRSLAVDYAARGIRANAICPGMIDTPMTHWRLADPELGPQVIAQIPQARAGEPEEIAEAVSVLASGRLDYINGAPVILDGGWSAK